MINDDIYRLMNMTPSIIRGGNPDFLLLLRPHCAIEAVHGRLLDSSDNQ